MKKVKIMLLSLALLAIVGGALAFKAKTTFNYCTAPVIGIGQTCGSPLQTCPTFVTSTTDAPGQQELVCYTITQQYTTGPNPQDVFDGCFTNIGNVASGDYRTAALTCQQNPQVLKSDF